MNKIKKILSTITTRSKDYKIGYYIGEGISRKLPSLGMDGPTLNQTTMKWGDSKKLKAASDKWYESQCKEDWCEYITIRYEMLEKYLPYELKIYLPNSIKVETNPFKYWGHHNKSVLKGIKDALWDSDVCEYNLIDIINVNDDFVGRRTGKKYKRTRAQVVLKLNLEHPDKK